MGPRPILILAAAIALAGCGGGTKTVVEVRTATAPAHAQTTSTAPAASSGGATTTTQQAPATGGTLSEAVAKLRAQGFTPIDTSDYDSSHTLRVLVGVRTGSGDGYAKRAFFFVGPRFIGTDTADDSAGVEVLHQQDTVVTLGYQLYRRNDPLCCPGGGQKPVRYRWNGARLVPLDPIPSSGNADLSRQ